MYSVKPLHQSFLYVAILIIATSAIAIIVEHGNSLPFPDTSTLTQRSAPVSVSHDVAEYLKANLDSPLSHLFIQLLVIIAVCRWIGGMFARIGLPVVVGEMTAGVLLGPSLFGALTPEAFNFVFAADSLDALRLLSQIGICFFMFTVGMELNIGHVRSKAATAVAVSHASIVLPFLLGVALAYFLFTNMAGSKANFVSFALFMGISMSITAFPVLARILHERGMSRNVLGSTAIACAAVDDATAWSIMAFVVAVAQAANLIAAGVTLLLLLCFIAVMVFGVRHALPAWIGNEQIRGERELSAGTLAIVVCVMIAAAWSTEVIGIHALFGAFLAGTVVPDVPEFRYRVKMSLDKFSSVLLLPLFFAFTGLRTDIGLLSSAGDWLWCVAIIGVATAGKLGGGALAARVTGMPWRESLQLGALMNTRGLMELIALNIGYDLDIVSPGIFAMLVIMAVVTTTMTGPLLNFLGVRQPDMARQRQTTLA
jgi:Kef-type K+ transport system membrane component KefB